MIAKGLRSSPLIVTARSARLTVNLFPSFMIVTGPLGSAARVELSSGTVLNPIMSEFFKAGLCVTPSARAASPPNPEHVTVSKLV